jgi:hypothetical protein
MSRLPKFIQTWFAEDALTWGGDFEKSLKLAIQSDVDFLIIFLDADALESQWVKKELDWALEREKELSRTFVLPIVFPDTPRERLPPALANRHFVVTDSADDFVELARRVSEELFHLVTDNIAALEKTRAFRPTTFDVLQGDWHECHFNYVKGGPQLVREQWQIDKHNVGSISDSGLEYRGVIGEDDYTLVALFEGVGHREVVICRFDKPMLSHSVSVRGMWFAVDHDKHIACGPEILTRNKLDDDSAQRQLQTSVEMHSELPLMKLRA